MATNKSTRDAIVTVAVVIAVAVTIMANLLADRKFARLDLTSEHRYSISKEFGSILNRLESTVDLTYYVSKQVPLEFEAGKRDILDKLNEIVQASHGKIKLLVNDPKDNPELREELRKVEGEIEIAINKKDERSRSLLTSSLKINYEAKPKVLTPFIGSAEQLEYLLGSKFSELTLKKKPIVAIDTPMPPQMPPMMQQQQQGSGYEWLQAGQFEDLKKFELKSVDLSENNSIPADASAFIIVRPKALNERQRFEVVKYLAGGGKVIMLASPFKVSNEFGSWRNEKTPTGLEDYLKDLGVTFSPDLVCDKSSMQMPSIGNNRIEMRSYPFFVRVLGENIDQESSLTRFMPGLLMPIPAEIKIDDAVAKKSGLVARVLAKTSKQSWRVPYSDSINPEKSFSEDDPNQRFDGSMAVVATIEGQFPFPYEGKPVPEWKKEEAPGTPPDAADKDKKKGENATLAKKPGTLMICSCPEAFHMMYLNDQTIGPQMKSNIFLMINILETFGLGNDDLVKLRTKRYETRTLEKLSGKEDEWKRDYSKYWLIFGVPILIVIFALTRSIFRNSAQTRYERKFAQTIGPSSFTP